MNQDQLQKVLVTLGEKLALQWAIKPEINFQGTIMFKNFVALSMKNTSEKDAISTNMDIIKKTVEASHATFNPAEWTQVIGPTGHLVITYKAL